MFNDATCLITYEPHYESQKQLGFHLYCLMAPIVDDMKAFFIFIFLQTSKSCLSHNHIYNLKPFCNIICEYCLPHRIVEMVIEKMVDYNTNHKHMDWYGYGILQCKFILVFIWKKMSFFFDLQHDLQLQLWINVYAKVQELVQSLWLLSVWDGVSHFQQHWHW